MENKEDEIWRSVKGYEGYYEVSNYGRVKSLSRKSTHGKILKPAPDKDGYFRVSLSKRNKKKNYPVHKLVAIAFLPQPRKGQTNINHIDENKQNDIPSNLEWCTPQYNTNYHGASLRKAAALRKPINQFSLDNDFIKRWEYRGEIERSLGVSGGNITSCCLGKRKKAYGYKWRYSTNAQTD